MGTTDPDKASLERIKALRVLMETMSCDFSSCRLAECIFVDDILGIFEFVYCIFFLTNNEGKV